MDRVCVAKARRVLTIANVISHKRRPPAQERHADHVYLSRIYVSLSVGHQSNSAHRAGGGGVLVDAGVILRIDGARCVYGPRTRNVTPCRCAFCARAVCIQAPVRITGDSYVNVPGIRQPAVVCVDSRGARR